MSNTIFANIRSDLYARFGHLIDSDLIDEVLERLIAEHRATATLTRFLPVLVAREATDILKAHVADRTDIGHPRQRIVFASRDNALRAVLASALTRELSGDAVIATAATTHPENRSDAMIEWVLDERGLDNALRFSTPETRTLQAPDVVVYLGSEEFQDLGARRSLVWDIARVEGMDVDEVRAFADDLSVRIAHLLESLGIPLLTRERQPV